MKKIYSLFPLLLIYSVAFSQPSVAFQAIIPSGLSRPVDVVHAKDGTNRLFIVEQTGLVKIWNGTALFTTPFLDVKNRIKIAGSEQGLLSLAFHPNYASNRYFFIYYNDSITSNITVRRYQTSTTDPNVADTTSGVTLFSIPKLYTNHNGGKLLFGPDGYLYFGTGDGGSGGDPNNNAQNGLSLLGKMIRVDVNGTSSSSPYYAIPPTNPFIGNANYRPEVFAIGLRNPWRYSIDRQTGNVWIADVGQDLWEEVNVTPAASMAGANYGWSCNEATHFYKTGCGAVANPSFIAPIFEYPHNSTGGYSITGGVVYRGLGFPALQGYYLCVDFVTTNGWLIKQNTTSGFTVTPQTWPSGISSFGEGEDSTLYATKLSGTLYKIIPSGTLPVHLISFNGKINANNYNELSWQVSNEEQGDSYILESSSSSTSQFTEVTKRIATSSKSNNTYTVVHYSVGDTYYRLKLVSKNGEIQYSSVVLLKKENKTMASYAVVHGSSVDIMLAQEANNILLYDAAGKLLINQKVTANSSRISLPLTYVSKGILFIQVAYADRTEQLKVVY